MVEKSVIDTEIEFCEHEHTHEEVLKSVSCVMPSDDIIYDVAELFKVFGDSTRTRILTALFESEMWGYLSRGFPWRAMKGQKQIIVNKITIVEFLD